MNNILVTMPDASNHIGVTMNEGGSGVTIADCVSVSMFWFISHVSDIRQTFRGGAVGIQLKNQQYNFKSLTFDGCRIGINITSVFVATFQNITFEGCDYGIDTSTSAGTISLVDSSVRNGDAGVHAYVSGSGQGSLTMDNFETDSSTAAVKSLGGDILLQDSVPAGQTWILGNVDQGGYQDGKSHEINRPPVLLSNNKYFTLSAPQYEQYDISEVVSLTGDADNPVYGDSKSIRGRPSVTTADLPKTSIMMAPASMRYCRNTQTARLSLCRRVFT